MSCREGSAGPKGWLWYQPTNDSPRRNRLWQICRADNVGPPPQYQRSGGHLGGGGALLYLLLHCARSLSVAQAAPAREGAQHRQHCGDGGWVAVPGAAPPSPPIAYAACWCPSGPPGSRPLHCASDGCGNPTGKGNAPMEPPKGVLQSPPGRGTHQQQEDVAGDGHVEGLEFVDGCEGRHLHQGLWAPATHAAPLPPALPPQG